MNGSFKYKFQVWLTIVVVVLFFGIPSRAAYAQCTPPATAQIYTRCPEPSATVLHAKDATFCAKGDGQTDDTNALQSFFNAVLECRIPGEIDSGDFLVTKSLYVQGQGPTPNTWDVAAQIYGNGPGTRIIGTVPNYAVLDLTNFNYGKLSDMTIIANPPSVAAMFMGVPAGTPTCVNGTCNYSATSGGTIVLRDITAVAYAPAVAALVDAGADAPTFDRVNLTGPIAMALTATDPLGVQSEYNTLLIAQTPDPYQNGTSYKIIDSSLTATASTALLINGMDAVRVKSSQLINTGTSSSAIKVTSDYNPTTGTYVQRGDALFLSGVVQKVINDTSSNIYFVDLGSGTNTQHGDIQAIPAAQDTAIFHIPSTSSINTYDINVGSNIYSSLVVGDVDSSGNQSVGALINSVVSSPSAGDLGTSSSSNTIMTGQENEVMPQTTTSSTSSPPTTKGPLQFRPMMGRLSSQVQTAGIASSEPQASPMIGKPVLYNQKQWSAPSGSMSQMQNLSNNIFGPGVIFTSLTPSTGLNYQICPVTVGPGQNLTQTFSWTISENNPSGAVYKCDVIDSVAPSALIDNGMGGVTSSGFTMNITNTDTVNTHTGEVDCTAISQ